MLHGSPRDALDGSFRYLSVAMTETGFAAKVSVGQNTLSNLLAAGARQNTRTATVVSLVSHTMMG